MIGIGFRSRALSLVRDFQEHNRYLIDDFLVIYCQRISKRDLMMKTEPASHGKKDKREYLSDSETKTLLNELNRYFVSRVEVRRIRNGEHQTIETLINEESLLFTKCLRGETQN